VVTTLEQWEGNKSTKIESTVGMCKHILSRDDAPEIKFSNEGVITYPPLPEIPEGKKTPGKTDQILIYCEFAALIPCIVSVLKLHGIDALYIDGNMSSDKRHDTVNKFRSGRHGRVLIMSPVGTTGLNLSCANHVIFFDQPWSAQDEAQFIGRAYRMPQKKHVYVYHLIALGTTDVLMCRMAQGKSEMLKEFLQRNSAEGMLVIHGLQYNANSCTGFSQG
ncbi:P-loop containing nucleoside triphosphate hydrolase protein, partial [Rickenella mellea]